MADIQSWLTYLAQRVIALILAFTALSLLCGKEGEPGGSIFALLVVFVVATVFGKFTSALKMNLPPLVGMLIAGLLLRNLPYIGDHVGSVIGHTVSSHIRDVALALILTRAGLGLDLKVLTQMKGVIFRLAFLPCIAEALMVALLSALLLDFNWSWSLMLGFLWAAISPAVVVPSMLSLMERGFGISTGIIPSIICSAALDDVLSIAMFTVFEAYAVGHATFSPVDFATVPLQLVAGIGLGVASALLLVAATPPGAEGETPALDNMRLCLVVGFAVVSLLGLKAVGYTACAALSVVVLAIGAAKGWGPAAAKRVAAPLTQIWNQIAQPLLFGLVGVEVYVNDVAEEPQVVAFGFLMLLAGLCARFLMAFLSAGCRGLNAKVKLFAALSQLPKATVQAALCGVALQDVRAQPNLPDYDTKIKWAGSVLHLSVLIILCTAPIGATIIYKTGPNLLEQDGKDVVALGESLVMDVDEPDPDVVEKVLERASFNVDSATNHGVSLSWVPETKVGELGAALQKGTQSWA